MGFKQIRTSDLSGIELDDSQVINVAVRHPDHEEGRQFDASEEELKGLKISADLVHLEFRYADGTTKEVFSTKTEFAKLLPPDKFQTLDPLRGRRKNWRPGVD